MTSDPTVIEAATADAEKAIGVATMPPGRVNAVDPDPDAVLVTPLAATSMPDPEGSAEYVVPCSVNAVPPTTTVCPPTT